MKILQKVVFVRSIPHLVQQTVPYVMYGMLWYGMYIKTVQMGDRKINESPDIFKKTQF